MANNEAVLFEDDGLPMLEDVGPWASTKYRKIGYYSSMFSSSMKRKWDCRVYMDLFAGPGKCRVEETGEILPGSPLLALGVADPYDKYVFCEKDPESMEALRLRVKRYFGERDVSFIQGDVNDTLDTLLSEIPRFSCAYKGLSFCFVDPCKMGDLELAALRAISENLYVDFLVLIPTYMDINRNEYIYARNDCNALDRYLGTDTWRQRWQDPNWRFKEFGIFVADEFCRQMQNLGYIYEGPEDMELVRTDTGNNLQLYHLAFFSKSRLALSFWRETKRNTTPQLSLWLRRS
jgi:three-Cys-motif partner protein